MRIFDLRTSVVKGGSSEESDLELLTYDECARKTNLPVRELRRQIWMKRRDWIAALRTAYAFQGGWSNAYFPRPKSRREMMTPLVDFRDPDLGRFGNPAH
jgi:hypothetical protein